MILAAAIFFTATLFSYSVGFAIEIMLRKDIVWGRPKTAREIAISEIPSSLLVGALVTAVIYIAKAVM